MSGWGGGFRPPPVPAGAGEGAPLTASLVEAPVPLEAPVWFVERDARPMGPYRAEQLRTLWQQNRLDADPLLWCESWTHWRRLSRVPALVRVMTRAAAPVAVDARPFLKPVRTSAPRVERRVELALGPKPVEQEEPWQAMWQAEQARRRAREEGREVRPEPVTLAAVKPPPVKHAAPPGWGETLLLICAILGPLVLAYVATSGLVYARGQGTGVELPARPASASPEEPSVVPAPEVRERGPDAPLAVLTRAGGGRGALR